MQIYVIKCIEENLNDKFEIQQGLNKSDLTVIPFGVCEEINYRKQLSGSSKQLVTLGRVCKARGGILLVGATSDNCGIKRKSVFVFEEGKLISICDMNCYEQKLSSAYGCKIINASGVKIGVLVDKDLFLPEAIKAFTYCGCGAIINLYADLLPKKASVAAEFYSYVYGVDTAVVASDKNCAFNACGEQIRFFNECVLTCKSNFKEVKIKKRGTFNV